MARKLAPAKEVRQEENVNGPTQLMLLSLSEKDVGHCEVWMTGRSVMCVKRGGGNPRNKSKCTYGNIHAYTHPTFTRHIPQTYTTLEFALRRNMNSAGSKGVSYSESAALWFQRIFFRDDGRARDASPASAPTLKWHLGDCFEIHYCSLEF